MKRKLDKLASFRINGARWEKFKEVAETQGKTATDLLNEYIDRVIGVRADAAPGLPSDNSTKLSIQDIDKRIDKKIANTMSIQDVDDAAKKLITDSLEDGVIGDAIAKSYAAMMGNFNELLHQMEELKAAVAPSSQSPVTNNQSPDTSPQSPITSPQSPVPSPQSPVTSPQSPTTNDQSPITEPAQIERSLVENIRTTLKRKGISATTEQIRAAFFAAGWNGGNYQEIRKDILEILSALISNLISS